MTIHASGGTRHDANRVERASRESSAIKTDDRGGDCANQSRYPSPFRNRYRVPVDDHVRGWRLAEDAGWTVWSAHRMRFRCAKCSAAGISRSSRPESACPISPLNDQQRDRDSCAKRSPPAPTIIVVGRAVTEDRDPRAALNDGCFDESLLGSVGLINSRMAAIPRRLLP